MGGSTTHEGRIDENKGRKEEMKVRLVTDRIQSKRHKQSV